MNKIFLLAFLLFSQKVFSQSNGETLNRVGGAGRIRPGMILNNGESTGNESPFFKENWMRGTLVFSNGKSQTGLLVKLDLFENNIHYLDGVGIENINVTPVREVSLLDTSSKKEFRFIHSSALAATGVEPGWYEVLCSGNSSLYKKTIKKLIGIAPKKTEDEVGPLSTSTQFYVLSNSKLFQIKKVKEIPEVLKDKKNELLEYIKSQKLGGKSENDMVSLIQYYNTLK